MNSRNTTYWIVSLSLLLSVSMVFPFFCHTDISVLFSHHQEMSSDVMHGQHQDAQQCDCGHELAKDYQKNKKVVYNQLLPFSPAVILPDGLKLPSANDFESIAFDLAFGLLNKSGPSLHLLNNVFLN